MKSKKWEDLGQNSVLILDSFYISYNPGNHLIDFFKGDNDCDETALCKNGKFYILNGDYRKEYEKLSKKGYTACKKFFIENIEHKSSWSN